MAIVGRSQSCLMPPCSGLACVFCTTTFRGKFFAGHDGIKRKPSFPIRRKKTCLLTLVRMQGEGLSAERGHLCWDFFKLVFCCFRIIFPRVSFKIWDTKQKYCGKDVAESLEFVFLVNFIRHNIYKSYQTLVFETYFFLLLNTVDSKPTLT